MKKYTTIIFDLYGTLLYTLEDLKNATNYALTECGYPERTLEEVRKFVGNGVRKLIERAVPSGTNAENTDKVFGVLKKYYDMHATDNTRLYDGVDKLLYTLKEKGYNLAIVSNKIQSAVDILHDRFFKDTIQISIGDREGQNRKPAPDSVLSVMEYFHAAKDETLYVGDSEVDILTAKNAEVDCISVSWGFRDTDELMAAGATIIVKTPEQLVKKLA